MEAGGPLTKNEVFCMILQNALVYTPRHTFERGTLFIRNGRIVPFAAPEAGEEVIDVNTDIAVFIDL